ncbi:aldehyde dehydrogenase family protein [Cupriavidus sp. CuC1]|uniref:aldehyde dehydrogenase family protein n=1 Tax=Cupriavidus sp. CuC1 TaxID=3373131 RepID=UPI0037CD0FF5
MPTSNSSAADAQLPVNEGHRRALEWVQTGPKKLLIGGEWVNAKSNRTFDSFDPSTEQRLTSVAEADALDVDAAVVAARKAFEAPSWSGITPHARTRALLKIAEMIDLHADELAALESLDNGMPLWYSTASAAAAGEVFRYYAGWPSKMFGTTNPTDSSAFLYTVREPMGVCGQINAWNVPLMQAAIKISTALACGNTVVMKPAEQAPLSTLRLAELILETNLPPGVLNILPGFGPSAGAAIAAHLGIDKVAFTGSTAIGKQILEASIGNLKKVTLELGGKSPNIIFPDADIEKAVQSAVKSFCSNSGQVCSAGTRVFVHESLHDEVSEHIAKIAATYKVGSPFASDTKLGPLISAKQLERVLHYIESGKEAGATLLQGGCRIGGTGHFVEPTVFSGVANTMKIAQEEIFGPVVSIIPFKDENDAVFQGNDTQYGLAAAVWTRDISRAHTVARRLKAGRVWINTYGEADPVMAFGGYKQSGIGREFGAESIDAYTQTKAVLVRF